MRERGTGCCAAGTNGAPALGTAASCRVQGTTTPANTPDGTNIAVAFGTLPNDPALRSSAVAGSGAGHSSADRAEQSLGRPPAGPAATRPTVARLTAGSCARSCIPMQDKYGMVAEPSPGGRRGHGAARGYANVGRSVQVPRFSIAVGTVLVPRFSSGYGCGGTGIWLSCRGGKSQGVPMVLGAFGRGVAAEAVLALLLQAISRRSRQVVVSGRSTCLSCLRTRYWAADAAVFFDNRNRTPKPGRCAAAWAHWMPKRARLPQRVQSHPLSKVIRCPRLIQTFTRALMVQGTVNLSLADRGWPPVSPHRTQPKFAKEPCEAWGMGALEA
jgi:hypothetical protein